MKLKPLLFSSMLTASLAISTTSAWAENYMPFVLGSSSSHSVSATTDEVKASLTSNGFEVVGDYAPNANTQILVVTNTALKSLAAKSKHGGFGAMERVSIVNHKGNTEVSYTNPTYQYNAYRMEGDISGIQASMEKALGAQSQFGAEEALSAEDLRGYHYKMMMPYFDDEDELASYASHEQAISTIESGLAAKKGGLSKIYRIDIPGTEMTVFGISFSKGEGADNNILNQIDQGKHSHAAHLPYEILVVGDEAIALNGKFRIAISWPSLSMMGSNSFMSIANAPDEMLEAMEMAAEK